MELIKYKYIWNNLIILLTIYIIYLIYQNYKMTEEKFQAIINVHYQETNSAQTLYITYSDSDSTIIDYKRILSNIQNIIALFPSNVNSEEVFMLDSSHALYLVNSANKSSQKITFESIVDGEEYPVKVVTNASKAYALTNIGNIFEIDNTTFVKKTLDDDKKFLDFAVKDNDDLYMINTEGNLYKYNNSTTLIQLNENENEKYLQIIGLGDKVSVLNASSKTIYGISDRDDIVEIISTVPLNVSLICNATCIGYYNISECKIYNYLSSEKIKDLDYGFKFASLINDYLVGIENDDNLKKKNLTTPTTDFLVCSGCSKILLFAGSEIANIFYIPFEDTNTTCPKEFGDCDLCDTTVVENDMNCGLIMDAIGTLINELT